MYSPVFKLFLRLTIFVYFCILISMISTTVRASNIDTLGDFAEHTFNHERWSVWADGDVIESYRRRDDFTNRRGRSRDSVSVHPDALLLIRPTILYGEPGDGFWAAVRAEIGSEGRRQIEYVEGQPDAGIAGYIGFGDLSVTIANGATQDGRYAPVSFYRSVFSPSYQDGTYTNRITRAISAGSLDASRLWNTMTGQILTDDFVGGEVEHETIAVRYKTDLGSFGLMTDFGGNAYQLEYNYKDQTWQLNANLGWVNGISDRWNNAVDDMWLELGVGVSLSDNWTVDATLLTAFGETRSNSAWGKGSHFITAGSSLEFLENHHLRAEVQFWDRQTTNAAARTLNFLRSTDFQFSYGLQFSRNLYAEAYTVFGNSTSLQGTTSTVTRHGVSAGFKF